MNKHAQAKTIIKKTLKTHANNIKNGANHRAKQQQQENFPPLALALRIHLSRAHAASPRPLARTARTTRTRNETETDFPVADSSLNLRYYYTYMTTLRVIRRLLGRGGGNDASFQKWQLSLQCFYHQQLCRLSLTICCSDQLLS